MLRFTLGVLLVLIGSSLTAQDYPYAHFNLAYQLYPNIPRGMLEAISYTQTHVRHVLPTEDASCTGMPHYMGVMGLVADGKGVFRENLKLVSQLTTTYQPDLINFADKQIYAFAKAYHLLNLQLGPFPANQPQAHLPVLAALSELPLDTSEAADFVLNTHFYSVLSFLNDPVHAAVFRFPAYQINLQQVFGPNYDVLSSSQVIIGNSGIYNTQGQPYSNSRSAAEYPSAIWNPAATCNYSSRSGVAISAVTVHTVQGSYAGCISWFKNCNAGVSAHYVIRSSDGQVTQMVPEANKAWHVGSENPYTVGIEHEGYVNDPSWYTPAMYQSSANLVKYLAAKYNINPLSTYKGSAQTVLNACYRIKGHIHYPNQTHTDPGPNWNWPLYHNLINDTIATTRITACAGTFTDNGGAGNYTDLTKYLTIIQPTGAVSVTINFSSFSTEAGYDSLYIYNGPGPGSPLIGAYTGTQNPGSVTATSGVMGLLFTSDCSINSSGWSATYTCAACPGTLNVAIDSLVPATCNPGYIRVAATGGNPPYSYVWGNGTIGPVRTNMPAGAFTVSVTDASGCMVSRVFSVPAVANPTVRLSALPITCFGGETTVMALGTGGTQPYTYAWNVAGNDSSLIYQPAGTYSVTLTDAVGCTATASTLISEPDEIVIITDSLSHSSCYGGYLSVRVIGGVGAPYTYNWSDGSNDTVRSGLVAGTYTLVVSDANGCQQVRSFTINGLNSISVQASIDSLTCPGAANGTIAIAVSGGVAGYSYEWSTGVADSVVSGLSAGVYSLTVTDSIGCFATASFVLPMPDSVVVDGLVRHVSCSNAYNGSIYLTPIYGSLPMQYNWGNANSSTLLNVGAGNYTVTVTDARGCSATYSYTVMEPQPVQIWGLVPALDTIDVVWDSITGGNPPYTANVYCIIPDSSGQAANCNINIADANGCRLDTVVTVDVVQGTSGISTTGVVKLYPNPTDGTVYIELAASNAFARLKLYSALGQLLIDTAANKQTMQIDLRSYSPGTYWLVIEAPLQRQVLPIVKR